MKPLTLLCITSCLVTAIANASEAPVVDIIPSTNSLQQAQQRTDFSQREWRLAVRQVSDAESEVLEVEVVVQRLTQQVDEAKRNLDVAKQSLERVKQKEGLLRARWGQESSGLRQEVSTSKQ